MNNGLEKKLEDHDMIPATANFQRIFWLYLTFLSISITTFMCGNEGLM